MHSPTSNTTRTGVAAHIRRWTLRWFLTWISEIGMFMSRLTDQLQVKLDAEQERHHD
ncbi:MAG: hypothetical protein KKA55_08040 [Proteobacteria bacterium]|nr:hypothetical protein [Pseudomonadota bacterium]MBU1595467.1 hypothetical protein [Pseudomonadota bacterium]